jgi:hypothetical protein
LERAPPLPSGDESKAARGDSDDTNTVAALMKVLAPVKRVVDANVKVRVKAEGSGVDLANVKMPINPFDDVPVEEAVRLKEHGVASGVRQCSGS